MVVVVPICMDRAVCYSTIFLTFNVMKCDRNTWEQPPLLAVLKRAIRTANLGSSIHTFFCGLELPPLAVLWSLHRTADLGSSNGSFRPW